MISIFVAVTDFDWYRYLAAQPGLEEVNFWQPGGKTAFKALRPGELFLFKLHSPRNFIVGGGIFGHASFLPVSMAWEAFGHSNGATSLTEMRTRIARYRREQPDHRQDYQIGCRLLEQPFFFPEDQWIPVPPSWSPNIVVGKSFSADDDDGRFLWDAVQDRLQGLPMAAPRTTIDDDAPTARYGAPTLITPRLGQGTFRVAVTDSYGRRCAVTGEKTLPILDAAHIKDFGEGGNHTVDNGLLLRTDIHRLFDRGYVTVSDDHRFVVSRRLKEDFDNGRHYYELHGTPIRLPDSPLAQPSAKALHWHWNNRFLG
ncbi:HNH endonuclease [Nitrospirillum viridazoti]|uniref:Restriction endonuclease n=1 Tax=Nitrospirillum viridazoti CBAmc TaxID=1441467 RepID=A0A248JWZ7_9PROT|nr:HNH endonuclease [Nitrospirillum amazonense]ASG23243.1 restriction endonuclease [Nitrospirillum amazonense CBAmc]TWB39002.1 putative restriction endonuclease [Nitrospirillum amazonense]